MIRSVDANHLEFKPEVRDKLLALAWKELGGTVLLDDRGYPARAEVERLRFLIMAHADLPPQAYQLDWDTAKLGWSVKPLPGPWAEVGGLEP